MKVEQTIQLMQDKYSDLFYNRKSCLDHLFCVIGNGYEWINGELVDPDDKDYIKEYSIKNIKKAEFNEDLDENKEYNWYPLSKEYSYLYNYPENIKEDWLEAINECKKMLLDDGIIF